MLQRSCNADKLGASLIFSYHFLVLFSFLSIAFLIEEHCIDAKGVFSRKNFQSSEDTFCALYAHFFSQHALSLCNNGFLTKFDFALNGHQFGCSYAKDQ